MLESSHKARVLFSHVWTSLSSHLPPWGYAREIESRCIYLTPCYHELAPGRTVHLSPALVSWGGDTIVYTICF